MNITVVGGTGMIGRRLVALLRQQGHEVVTAARSTGVDTFSGDGLTDALACADVVVDVSNSGYADAPDMRAFFNVSTRNILKGGSGAGIAHFVALSAVGANRLHGGYFEAKKAQEDIILGGDIPYSIVRSTPFFEYVYKITDAGGAGDDIRLPPVLMQPIAADDVVKALALIAVSRPANAIIEIAGPDRDTLPDMAVAILTANEDMRRVIVDEEAPYFGARFQKEPLTGGEQRRFSSTSFADWLRAWIAVD